MSERFMAVPFWDGRWKVLDCKVQRYTRAYPTRGQADRYARRKNGPVGHAYRRCDRCLSAPCCCEGARA